ncbi:MAG TPA: threonine--tRNA ligase [Patescibacteria group bacterium]|nr:threonine--tRNA ligase [Patescibacteria group bacterium]
MNQTIKDHKQLGIELELFFTHEYAPGAPFWLPKGMIVFKELEKYIRELTGKNGYLETSTPIMVKSQLFKESGHWEKFGEHNMYNLSLSEDENDKHPVDYTLKPMNCPESTIIYRFRTRTYKELPLRLSELGRLHRREKSGEVNGLLRVRQITMDDAHIYVTEDQIQEEISNILDMMIVFYTSFGFEFDFCLATRPETFAGTVENWIRAEKALEQALKDKDLKYSVKDQDGAFYGPKIDVHIKDALGRDWQLATVQLDFHQPQAFKLAYIDRDGKEKQPVMIHRAIFGSFERFLGILTEHYQGAFPLWLSPVQVMLLPIADRHTHAAQLYNAAMQEAGIRSEVNDKKETLQSKIRLCALQKVPFMGIIGDKEIESDSIAVRTRSGEDIGVLSLSKFLLRIREDIDKKA